MFYYNFNNFIIRYNILVVVFLQFYHHLLKLQDGISLHSRQRSDCKTVVKELVRLTRQRLSDWYKPGAHLPHLLQVISDKPSNCSLKTSYRETLKCLQSDYGNDVCLPLRRRRGSQRNRLSSLAILSSALLSSAKQLEISLFV